MANWSLAAIALSIPLVALVMWISRRSFLDGVDCTTLGPYDCGYDANLAAGYGALAGVLFLLGAGVARVVGQRRPWAGLAAIGVIGIGWVVVAVMLIVATRS